MYIYRTLNICVAAFDEQQNFIQQLGPAFLCKNLAVGEKAVLAVSWSVFDHDTCNSQYVRKPCLSSISPESISGKEYFYTGMEARCADCGSPLYVPEISDASLEALYHVFREDNGIAPLDVIRAIPEKYAIGKRPLSLSLGCSEQTFTRYCDGDVPTRQYSDMLLRIYNELHFYAKILEANKDNLKSMLAYEKNRRAVDALLTMDTEP